MKYFKLLFLILVLACEPNVVFEEALPPDIDSINMIPEQFQGIYMCESDSSRMHIKRDLAFQESFYFFRTSLKTVRETENCSTQAGGLYLPGRNSCVPFEYISEDSIMAKVYEQDTLFSFANNETLKLYKGHLFLNKQNNRGHWMTWRLTPQTDGQLLLQYIDIPNKRERILEVSEVIHTRKRKKKKAQYIIKPTLIEFDRILKKGYTTECEMLIPLESDDMHNF